MELKCQVSETEYSTMHYISTYCSFKCVTCVYVYMYTCVCCVRRNADLYHVKKSCDFIIFISCDRHVTFDHVTFDHVTIF